MIPQSCDTFVVLPPLTKDGAVIFGKNSDRPQNEVQEVVYYEGKVRAGPLKCTYITIKESEKALQSVILSKPAWIWGAEMGANDQGVVVGNEAVWTNNNDLDGDARQKRLLGMDLVRLALERGNSAEDALQVITSLLEEHGQGGPCSELDDSHFYHNSFLIADAKEAWVLETTGRLWAAERITSGYRNISNGLTITTKIDRQSPKLREKAKEMGVWDGQSEFNFTKCFSSGGDEFRQQEGARLLREGSSGSDFDVRRMCSVLRDKESRICRGCDDTFPTQGSQVSRITTTGPNVHWFTATPDPSMSLFKPFVFSVKPQASEHTASPSDGKREHRLYKLHAECLTKRNNEGILNKLRQLEEKSLKEIPTLVENKFNDENSALNTLFKDQVETEMSLYA